MRSRTRRRGGERARVIPALLFALVWLFGYEVAPLAHQALHAQLRAHVHGTSATAEGAHCHEGVCHGGRTQAPRTHGDGSLEHRGVAALPHAIVIFVPELTLAGELPREVVLAQRVSSFEASTPPARGPPA